MKLNTGLFLVSILLCIILLTSPLLAAEDFDPELVLEEKLDELELAPLLEIWEEMNRDLEQYLPQLDLYSFVTLSFREGFSLDLKGLLGGLFSYFLRELVGFSRLLGQLIIISVISAILTGLQDAFEEESVAQLAQGIVFLVLALLALNSFRLALSLGREALANMVDVMHALLPLLLSLLISMGALTSAALLHPLVILIINSFALLIRNLVLPLIFLAAVLGVVDQISGQFSLSRLAGLLREASVGLMGLALTILIAFLSLQGVAASVGDGITLRTAKYLAGSFLPVVGGMFADALEILVGTSLFLKHALGIFGLIVLFFVIAFPILKILALCIVYKVASAVIQPICGERLVKSLNDLGNSLTLVFAAVASVGMAFFIMITVVVGVANLTVMLR